MTTPRQQKKFEKKLRKARDRFRESAMELIRLYAWDPEVSAGTISSFLLPGPLGAWTVQLGPSGLMAKHASDSARKIRESVIQQAKAKLGAENYDKLKLEIAAMIAANDGGNPQKEEEAAQ